VSLGVGRYRWNCALIDNSFPAYVANIIKNIPLCPSLPPDKIIWNGTLNGVFSVKSAYHMTLDLLRRKNGECSSSSGRSEFWKKIWAVKAPNASKNFLWRPCQNALPTKQNLLRKGVVDNDLCPYCQLEVESVIHALWNCPSAQDVWGCGPILFQKCPSIFSDMAELVSYLFTRLNDDLMSLTMVVFHRIWLRRNKMIFDEQFYSPMKVFIEASQFFEDFKMYNLRESLLKVPNVEGSNICKSWKLPNAGFVKVNWDASLNPKSSLVGLGCVIRNENGYVIGAKCYACRATVDPLCAEAMAALFALEFGYEMDFVNIESEGDSLQVIKGLCNPDFSLDRFGHFMDAIKQKASCFFVCKWRHCYREANEVAHILVRKASSICLSHVWVEDLPYFISSTSFRDLLASRL